MAFSLTLDKGYRTKASVMYRAGRLAGLDGRRPNPFSIDDELYRQGYFAGCRRRTMNQIAVGIVAFTCYVALTAYILL
jgi:hypothetical protein